MCGIANRVSCYRWGTWLRGPLQDLLYEVLSPTRLSRRGWFNPTVVGRLLHEHVSRQRVHTHQLWALVMFELWAQTILDSR